MTGRVTSVLRLRSVHVELLAAILLIIGGTQASLILVRHVSRLPGRRVRNRPKPNVAL